ncbi:sugar ABC transporter permease [Paenibacillus sp. HB172176]|uniref:carbohydrate ABC transporter permease n=1 Tax=Paenibacillus sp. HB172176 TaxID=2493690 RepID=UPI001439E7AF|nr:sugar ABC transporter permease [Paenibacillus sp. HB172176]
MVTKRKLQQVSYTFVLPAVLLYVVFFIYPSIQSFYYALTDWNGISPDYHIVGMDNFIHLWSESRFLASFKNTFIYAIGLTLGQSILGLVFALLLQIKMKGQSLFRSIFFSPQIMSLLAIGYIWSYIYDPGIGSLNMILNELGLSSLALNWLGDMDLAIWSIVFVSIWQGAGWCMVIYLANLQSIPQDLYEAASIDGAGTLKRFRHVTFPLLAPAITITLVTGTIVGLKAFDLIMSMTHGGPGYVTESISTVMYDTAFNKSLFGEAQAMGIVMFIIIFIITILQLTFLKKREVDV